MRQPAREKAYGIGAQPRALRSARRNYGALAFDAQQKGKLGIGDSLNRFLVDGELTAERKAVHDSIIEQLFAGKSPAVKPQFTMMGGGTGAGKSRVLESGMVKYPQGSVIIDSDAIKTMLPEYQYMQLIGDDNWASYLHEESSRIAKQAMARANEKGYNYVLDGTGNGTLQSLTKKIQDARDAGMPVMGYYVNVPTETALSRAASRAAKTGRSVDVQKATDIHRAVSEVMPQAAHLFDMVKLYDNSGPKPILIAVGGDGKGLVATPGNEALLEAFLRKALR